MLGDLESTGGVCVIVGVSADWVFVVIGSGLNDAVSVEDRDAVVEGEPVRLSERVRENTLSLVTVMAAVHVSVCVSVVIDVLSVAGKTELLRATLSEGVVNSVPEVLGDDVGALPLPDADREAVRSMETDGVGVTTAIAVTRNTNMSSATARIVADLNGPVN
jgi:hypothetical protein